MQNHRTSEDGTEQVLHFQQTEIRHFLNLPFMEKPQSLHGDVHPFTCWTCREGGLSPPFLDGRDDASVTNWLRGSSAKGESAPPPALLTRVPPDNTRRPQLHILRVAGGVTTCHVRRWLGVGIAVVVGVLLLWPLLLLVVVVVQHCSRVVRGSVGRVVGLVAGVRQRLDWRGGNIWGQ